PHARARAAAPERGTEEGPRHAATAQEARRPERRRALEHARRPGQPAGERHPALERRHRPREDPAAVKEDTMRVKRLGLVGYGEVGKIFASGLKPFVGEVAAWD